MSIQHVLLVEDDPEQRDLYQLVLEPLGYHLRVAADAESALVVLEQTPIDLVLTDWMLTGMEGTALIAKIHQSYPNVKTLLMSTYSHVNEAADAVGADGWYRKGSDIFRLRTVVTKVLEERSPTLRS